MRSVDQAPTSSREMPMVSAQRGYTMVEILVVLAIVAMAALIAIPNLQRIRVQTGTSQALFAVSGAFELARAEALKRHSPIGVVYDTGGRTLTVFEDWDPDNTPVDPVTDGDGILNGREMIIVRRPVPTELNVMLSSPGGDTDPKSLISTVVYATDGSLRSGGGAAYFADDVNNTFRVAINQFTGTVRVEGFLPDNTWTEKRKEWVWKY